MSALTFIGQDDFAAGVMRGLGRDSSPGIGVFNAINGLFDDDGDVYRRGGDSYLTAAADGPITFVWSGVLAGKLVGLVATATSLYSLDTVAWTLTKIPGPGLPVPVLGAVVGDLLFLPNGVVWGGSTRAAYSTGTASLTQGQAKVTGAGTAWTGAVEPGMLIVIGGVLYPIEAVVSNTELTLGKPFAGATAAGVGYSVVASSTHVLPGTGSRHLAAIANRLVVATNNRIAFSVANDPLTFVVDDFHELPDGVTVTGMLGLRDLLFVFSAYGLWTVQNMALDLTDAAGNPQQSLSRLTPELTLLNEAGLCEYSGAIVAPCKDRIFLVDGLSAPIPITDSVGPLYMRHVRAGATAGNAKVFRNHLFLPMLLAGAPIAVLVCRLNRPVRGRQTYYPFSTLSGHAAGILGGDVFTVGVAPRFLVGHTDGRIAEFTDFFNPSAARASDADGTAFEFDLETRDYPTGNGQPNHTRKLRVYYTLEGDGSFEAGYSFGGTSQSYQDVADRGGDYADLSLTYSNYGALLHGADSAWTSADDPDRVWFVLDAQAPESPGLDPIVWNLPLAERVRWIRARFRCFDPVARLTIHRVEFAVRPANHQR